MMPYDDFSARVFERTNWRALGAVYRPPARLRQWGAPLNDAERQALGVARLAAASARDGQGTAEFQQQHPKEPQATLNCVAWASSAGGWKIDLVDTRGERGTWVLKADLGAVLICDCHCEWGPACPGVVSVPAGSVPPPEAPPPPMQMTASVPMPSPSGIDPALAASDDSRQEQAVGWAAPATAAPQSLQAPSVPGGWRWPSSVPATSNPTETDRGELHAYHETPQPWLSLPAPESSPPVARLDRRSIFGALFGRRDKEPPAATEHRPAVPFIMKWPETYPTDATLPVVAEPQAGWPSGGSLYSPGFEPPAEIEGWETRRGVPAGWVRGGRGEPADTLPAPDSHFAALEPPADSYALGHPLPPPENYPPASLDWEGGEDEQLSTQSEILQFLADVNNAPLPPLRPDDRASDESVPSLPVPDGTVDQN